MVIPILVKSYIILPKHKLDCIHIFVYRAYAMARIIQPFHILFVDCIQLNRDLTKGVTVHEKYYRFSAVAVAVAKRLLRERLQLALSCFMLVNLFLFYLKIFRNFFRYYMLQKFLE